LSWAAGILAKAALSGAKTVMPEAEFRVSTSPAAFTAATRVDRAGLADAAVATGAADMPLKLPAPVAGTDEQADPNGADAVLALLLAAAGAEVVVLGVALAAVLDPLEPQAAAPTAMLAAAAAVSIILYFTVTPL
jgi:hypothetical protein